MILETIPEFAHSTVVCVEHRDILEVPGHVQLRAL
jgi:hypothetical protein